MEIPFCRARYSRFVLKVPLNSNQPTLPYCSQFTSRGPPPSPCSVYPRRTARLEATSRKTSHTGLRAIEGRSWPSELWPRNCLEKGHYSRRMATYCGHSNASAEYAQKKLLDEHVSASYKQPSSTPSAFCCARRPHRSTDEDSPLRSMQLCCRWVVNVKCATCTTTQRTLCHVISSPAED